MLKSFSCVLLAVALGACASKQAPVATPPGAPAALGAPAAPASPTPNDIRWVQDSAEYQAAVIQVYRLATARVEQATAKRPSGSWGVVLDADETILNNSVYQLERAKQGLTFSADSWNAWVKRREATPLPGAAAFLNRVRSLGGKIAIVTNRLQSECEDTRAVFDTHKLAFDAMLCRPDGTPSDKNPRFEAVANGSTTASSIPLDIVAFVGDNILDFPQLAQAARKVGAPAFTEFGVRFFIIPNPMYGSWQ
jgi:5'-nucleotidase (lipoprotein e(P4) family)